MGEFVTPKVDTRQLGEVRLEFAFRIVLELDRPAVTKTPRGGRIYQRVTGGTVSGPKLNGAVHADGGGEYGLRRDDGVDDLSTHYMLRDERGEWIYVEQIGYFRRTDRYCRLAAYFDAEKTGRHAWLNDSVLIASGTRAADERRLTLDYYEAL